MASGLAAAWMASTMLETQNSEPYPSASIPISFSFFDHKTDNCPKMRRLTWGEAVRMLTAHHRRTEKDGPLFSPATYAANARRRNEEVLGVVAAVGDFDHDTLWETITSSFNPYEYVVYSTFRHTEEHPRFRVIIPFSKVVPASKWPAVKATLDSTLFSAADQGASDASRMYYLPSCPPDNKPLAIHHPGAWLDWTKLPLAETGQDTPKQASPIGATIPAGRRNKVLTSLAGSMRRRGASEEAILAAIRAENELRCRPPLLDRELEAIARGVGRYPPAQRSRRWRRKDDLLVSRVEL